MNHDWHNKYGQFSGRFAPSIMLIAVGVIVRIAPNHLSFDDNSAQTIIYGFGTENVTSMKKDRRFFTP